MNKNFFRNVQLHSICSIAQEINMAKLICQIAPKALPNWQEATGPVILNRR
jgi:hypothetical protein